MDIITIILLAIGLAMDCFAVSITNGIALRQFHFGPIIKMALLFGLFQAGMPVIGWLLGVGFKSQIEFIDHWIAFGILLYLGIKMIKESLIEEEDESLLKPTLSWKKLFVLAIATSIDAFSTGFIFLTESVKTFVFAVAMIGVFSFGFSLAGNLIGIHAGKHLPVNMEMIGGLVLIGIGVKILLEHMAII